MGFKPTNKFSDSTFSLLSREIFPEMDSPAATLSNSLHFPSNFLGKLNLPHFLLLPSKIHLRSSNSQVQTLASTSTESNGVTVVSPECQSGQGPLASEKCRGWIHFVGIGGCGLSALAMLALKQGYEVSGSEIKWSSFMDGLQRAGATLNIGHSVWNIQKNTGFLSPDAVVISSAIPQDNEEVEFANSIGVPVYTRRLWLEKITTRYNLIAVSGSHGKSTTTSMLAYALKEMGDDLTALVGAHVPQFPHGNIISGSGKNFVLEADEYDGCFLDLSPYIAVILNLDWEHVDIFQNEEAVKCTFRRFLDQIKVGGYLILCGDSPGAYSLLDHTKQTASYRTTTYGLSNNNEWHASSIHPNSIGGSNYTLCHNGDPVIDISLRIPGAHNVLNSLAVVITIITLLGDQIPFNEIIKEARLHLNNFIGVSRRFEMIGTVCGCHVYDDYAHHPTEVRSVLQAACQKFPSKHLLAVFQPHTYSRLAAFKEDFADALSLAHQVVVTEVYAARETDVWNVGGIDLALSIIGLPVEYIPSLGDVVNKLVSQISCDPYREIIVLTLGAGDVTSVGPDLLHRLQQVLHN